MEFDLLVRKYLRGTLSSQELERLRDLLERVPEYRNELRQILELRSIIHDDALRLVPPRELSDRTRETVGAQFAGLESLLHHDASRLATPGDLADATRMSVGQLFAAAAPSAASAPEVSNGGEEEEEPRRRAVILPLRSMGRVLLAASLATVVALAPTMLGTDDEGPNGLASRVRISPSNVAAPSASRSPEALADAGSSRSATMNITSDREASVSGTAVESSRSVRISSRSVAPQSSRTTAGVDRSASTSRTAQTDRLLNEEAPAPEATNDPRTDGALATAIEREPFVIDPDNPLSRLPMISSLGGFRAGSSYNPALDSVARRPEALPEITLGAIGVTGLDDDGRLLAVGVTLGSGNVMDAEAPAALMQNSYYFSFSVSDDDRIGIEMGGSKFLQETHVPGKRPSGDIFAKGEAGGDSSLAPNIRGGEVTPPMIAQMVKQDITYGGIFYDRRLEVDRRWDLCGRVTFGAADGALVGGVRAYAAYSPLKNVTLTLGLGGSKLFDLKGRDNQGSTNYGLYYGVETGF